MIRAKQGDTMNTMNTKSVVRIGMVRFQTYGHPARYKDVVVKEYGNGTLVYYHRPCNTSDGWTSEGWVTLPEEYRNKVVWGDRSASN